MRESLEDFIKAAVDCIQKGMIGEKVTKFEDAKSKYAVLKNRVIIKIELTTGKMAELDVTDYFYNEKGELI